MKCRRCHREIKNPKSVQLIKEFERDSGHRTALVRIRSKYTIAEWNYHLKKWVAGDGYALTPEAAVEEATYDTLHLFETQKEALSKVIFYFGR